MIRDPFPHLVIDDLLPPTDGPEIARDFPAPDARWRVRKHLHSSKATLDDITLFPHVLRSVVNSLYGEPICRVIAHLFSLEKVEPDWLLYGGGLHVSGPGDFLDIHADFSHHPVTGLARVANLLLYLTPDWREEWGGHLELWSPDMQRCVRRIAPVFNRAVIFATSATSFHGHPTPLRCPQGIARRSLALYYYAAVKRPMITTTDYRPRPQDWMHRLRRAARRLVRRSA